MSYATGRPVAPSAEDLAAARELAYDTCDRAVARYHEAQAEAREAWRLVDHDDRRDLEKWANLTQHAATQAEERLVSAILAWSPDAGGGRRLMDAHLDRHEPRGIVSNGRLYLAIPDPCQDGQEGDGCQALMRLAIVPAASIVDIEAIPEPAPAATISAGHPIAPRRVSDARTGAKRTEEAMT